jgi:hypothetical protein
VGDLYGFSILDAEAVPDALAGAAKAQAKEPPGFWEVLRLFRSRNLRRGLAVMNGVLEVSGKRATEGERRSYAVAVAVFAAASAV